jgi:predicted O-linked N-acetylglucosamine transferase (SPINDLY family)
MEGTALQLAALRLAPVQCMAWGHPVTSGLPTVDYMLSSELMEPPDGDQHYTETLVRLPNLSIRYQPPEQGTGAMTRAEAGLRDDATVLLCCQSLFKYRPADDAVLAEIAAALPDAQVLFIGDPTSRIGEAFRTRLAPLGHQLVMTPPVAPERFPALLRLADIYLDTLEWSGGNTTLEAVAEGLPVVTLPGRFMRGRHSAAILTRMGLADLIAASRADYTARAIRLGRDPAWRAEVAARIRDGAPRLYGDDAPVRALEAFLAGAVERCG